MSLERIGDAPGGRPCISPEHNPPGMIVLQPGMYRHTCPSCGKSVVFTVYGSYCCV